MQLKSTSRWMIALLVLLVGLLVMAGCGGVPASPDQPSRALLPRVTINIDDEGNPSLLGFLSLDLVSGLIGQDLSAFRLSPELVQQLKAANIQNLEIVLTEEAIHLFANGQALPYLSMDDETWETFGQLAGVVGLPIWDTIKTVRENFLSQFGVQLALQLPVMEGVERMPLRDSTTLSEVDVDTVREAAGDPELVLHTDVRIGQDGITTIAGLPLLQTQMDPTLMAALDASGIQHFQFETEPEGLYSYLNGASLPRFTWDPERLANLVTVYEAISPGTVNQQLLDVLLPALETTDLQLTVYLPSGQAAAEVPTHPFVSGQ